MSDLRAAVRVSFRSLAVRLIVFSLCIVTCCLIKIKFNDDDDDTVISDDFALGFGANANTQQLWMHF